MAIRGLQLDTVEAGLDGIASGGGEAPNDLVNLGCG